MRALRFYAADKDPAGRHGFRPPFTFATRGAIPHSFGDGRDIDRLFDEIGGSSVELLGRYDLDGDGDIDFEDVVYLVEVIYSTWFGDAQMDGVVDGADLNIAGINWQASVTSWLDGDFNGDGVVNAADLNALGQNWLNGF